MTQFHPRLTATAAVTRTHDGKTLDAAKYDSAHIRFHIAGEAGMHDEDIGYTRALIVPNVRTHFDLNDAAADGSADWYNNLTNNVDRRYRDIGALITAQGILGRRDVIVIRDLALAYEWDHNTMVRTALHAIGTSFIARTAALIVADTDGWYTPLPDDENSILHRWAETDTGVIVP